MFLSMEIVNIYCILFIYVVTFEHSWILLNTIEYCSMYFYVIFSNDSWFHDFSIAKLKSMIESIWEMIEEMEPFCSFVDPDVH